MKRCSKKTNVANRGDSVWFEGTMTSWPVQKQSTAQDP